MIDLIFLSLRNPGACVSPLVKINSALVQESLQEESTITGSVACFIS